MTRPRTIEVEFIVPEHAPDRSAQRRPAGAYRPRRRRPRAGGPARPAAAPPVKPPSALEQAIEEALAAPEPAATTFGELGLAAPLVAALARQGIEAPFAIQARALPDALAGRDVLGRARTGSGKTLAFGLPMLARLAGLPGTRQSASPRGLVLVPTRELAKQVSDVLHPLARSVDLTVTTVYGGASMIRQIDRLRDGVDIVVATPGRLIDLMERGSCRLDRVEVSVLDEADHMSDLGFYPAVTRILRETPGSGQRLLFSATLDRDVERLVTEFLDEPALHAVQAPVDVAAEVDHQVFVLPSADKIAVAAEIASRPARTLFFVRTKHGADRLAKQITKAGTPAGAIHGNLNQGQRQRALDAFAAGHPRVLVATDVAARGLHIDDVGLVVHYDPPADHKDYLHRSGRTARAGASGTVLAFVDPVQLRDVAKIHEAAGVTPSTHEVAPGHDAVREIATSGEPVPPPPPPRPAAGDAKAAGEPGGRSGRRRPAGRPRQAAPTSAAVGAAAVGESRGDAPRRPRVQERGREPGAGREAVGGRRTGGPSWSGERGAGQRGRRDAARPGWDGGDGGRPAGGSGWDERGRRGVPSSGSGRWDERRGASTGARDGWSGVRGAGQVRSGPDDTWNGARPARRPNGAGPSRGSWSGSEDGAGARTPRRPAQAGPGGARRSGQGATGGSFRAAAGPARPARRARGDW